MKKFTILLLTAVLAFTISGWGQVFMTELADPNNNANARFIELYNAGATDVDFTEGSGWIINKFTNGSATVSNSINLTGTIISGDFYIIAYDLSAGTFLSVYGFAPDQLDPVSNGVAGANGDDTFQLIDGTGAVVDFYGVQPHADLTSTVWEYEDGRAERAAGATSGLNPPADADWTTWSDGPGGNFPGETKNAPGDFDPDAWIGASAGTGPIISIILTDPPSGGITSVSTVSVSANITDDGTIASAYLQWGTAPGTLTNTINMGLDVAPTYITDTDIPAQAVGTTVFYKVFAEDNDTELSSSDELSYTVLYPAITVLPYSETYDTDLGSCYVYSVLGATKTWEHAIYGSNGYANMNGYESVSGVPQEDWLIIPAINFDSYSNERMTFDTWYNYGVEEDLDNYLDLMWSSDYNGYGDPTSATWNEISFSIAANTNEWASSGTLDLSGVTGSNVHFAFKYNYQDGNWRWWQVDNIAIYEATPVNVTFQVNMEEQTVSPNGVHVAGSFQGWDPAATELLDPEMDGTYEVTVALISGLTYEFKYINGNAWGTNGVDQEIVPVECELPGTGNRYEVVGETDYTIPAVCYGSCNDCGTPQFDITFSVDMQNEVVSGDGVYLAGSLTNWGDGAVAMTATGTIWSVTVAADELSNHQYKFVNGIPNSGGTWENFDGPCLPAPWSNREIYLAQENLTADLVCFNSCDACPIADFVMINEVDADQASTDTQEFIELYDGGVGNTSLAGLVVVLYNGSDDQSYLPAIDLDGYSTNADGYFVIGSAGMGTDIEIGSTSWLQNGADAVALHIGNEADYPNDTPVSDVNLIDALVYGTNDGNDSGLLDVLTPGQPQVDESGRGNSSIHSNQRIPNGSGGLRMTMTYDQSLPTVAAENLGVYTDWTGAFDAAWDNAGNWHNGVPTDMLNAGIPDVSGVKAPFPVISGAATCLSLYMAPNSILWIDPDGEMTVLGTFTNNGGDLTIKSDATGTGSLIESNGVNANVERYLSQDRWHYVSAPVDDPLSGVFTDIYLMEWVEPTETWNYIIDPNLTLSTDMKGYAAWADNSLTGNATVVFDGALNAGSRTIAVTNNVDPVSLNSGFNFVGNPYPSGIDWNVNDGIGWTRTNVANSIYIWSHDDGQYGVFVKDGSGTFGVTNEIPQHQGFLVYCDDDLGPGAGSGTLSVDDGARIHTTQEILKGGKDSQPYVKFNVAGNGYKDEFIINVNKQSTFSFDGMYDGLKMWGLEEAPQTYTIANDKKRLSINSIPETTNQSIPVGVEVGVEGVYVLHLKEISEFDNIPIFVEDLKTNKIINIKNIASYKFKASPSDKPNRFLIHFSNNEAPPINELSVGKDVNIYTVSNYIVLNSNTELTGVIKIHDLMGREIYSETISETFQHEISSVGPNGYYILSFISDSEVYTEKVFIK